MAPSGKPECVRDNGAVMVWDGNYLPGLWLVQQALDTALTRIASHGVVTVAMRRSHHIACLATLVKQATDRGHVAILATSDPAFGFVAPYGGREPLLTPNPFAMGYPGTRTPVLVDICASITTVSMTRQKAASGEAFEHPWLLDAEGRPTRDPRVLEQTEPRGSLLLLGGLEYGHKGFGLALMVEALTQGLSGLGRKDTEKRWGGNVFLQVLDPEAFAGRDAFLTQMDHLDRRAAMPTRRLREGVPVRMPGEQAERNIAAAREQGVPLAEHTVQRLAARPSGSAWSCRPHAEPIERDHQPPGDRRAHKQGGRSMKLLGLMIGSMAMLAGTAFGAEYKLKLAHEVAIDSTQHQAAKSSPSWSRSGPTATSRSTSFRTAGSVRPAGAQPDARRNHRDHSVGLDHLQRRRRRDGGARDAVPVPRRRSTPTTCSTARSARACSTSWPRTASRAWPSWRTAGAR